MTDAGRALVQLVGTRLSTGAARWPFQSERPGFDPAAIAAAFASASRFLGKAPLATSGGESQLLRAAGLDWPIAQVGIDEAARMAVLIEEADHAGETDLVSLVEDLYRRGENRERQSVLRSLPLLPRPDLFVALAVDACRTSVQPIFEAIACENPYPAAFFPELNFNQMILKALFIEVALERVVGLRKRITPELRRMAQDHASERAAAGRSIPKDIALLRS
jgi:hypothetical protein